jgi:CubicO group peptidase (beta-lactamase class C family)
MKFFPITFLSVFLPAALVVSQTLAVECDYVAPAEGDDRLVSTRSVVGPRIRSFKGERLFQEEAPTGDLVRKRAVDAPAAEEAKHPHLDTAGFLDALVSDLSKRVAGFAMELRQNGAPLQTKNWQWAKRPADGSLAWQGDDRMHVASISKLVTAIAMVKALEEKNISFDAKIIDYLPGYWQKGSNVDKITFAQLFRHTSGLLWSPQSGQPGECEDISYADYGFIKSRVAKGVVELGKFCYANVNYGLLRVLLPIVVGAMNKDAEPSDKDWDDKTYDNYETYVRKTVLIPSNANQAKLLRSQENALAYNQPPTEPGWNSGNLSCLAGAAGWNMTVNEVLNVMGAFRRGGAIMSEGSAFAQLDHEFGIDHAYPFGEDNLYSKTGYWYWTKDDHTLDSMEQAVAVFLPEQMELSIFANSPVSNQPKPILILNVLNAYKAHITLK